MFDHYKDSLANKKTAAKISFQWIVYDSIIPDEKVVELMAPIEVADIEHGSNSSTVSFYRLNSDVSPLRHKLRVWTEENRAAFEAERQAESDAKFAAYLEKLKLELGDPVIIQIPGIIVHRDGRHEATVFEEIHHW